MEAPAPLRLRDALALLEGPAPVSIRFVKADRRRKTGGEFVRLPAARYGSGKRTSTPAKRVPVPAADAAPVAGKAPNHFANATRNLVDTTTGKLVKVHIYLIVEVQGRKVII